MIDRGSLCGLGFTASFPKTGFQFFWWFLFIQYEFLSIKIYFIYGTTMHTLNVDFKRSCTIKNGSRSFSVVFYISHFASHLGFQSSYLNICFILSLGNNVIVQDQVSLPGSGGTCLWFLHSREKGMWISEFKDNLAYRKSSGTVRVTQRNPV